MKDTKRSFLTSCVALFLCFAMLLGTTFAWFTDVVTSSGNKIVSGTLDLDLQLKDKDSGTYSSINESSDPIFNYDKWEPGYTDAKVLKVENVGSLAFKWVGNFVSREAISNLSEVIDVYIKTSDSDISYPADREELTLANGWKNIGTLNQIIDAPDHPVSGALLSGESDYFAIALHMQESAGNEYQGKELGAFDIAVHAAQYSAEEDSFDKDYDKDAAWPEGVIHGGITASANVSKDANGKLSSAVSVQSGDNKIGADLPAGVQLEDGKDKITVTVSNKTEADANVSLSDTEKMLPIDVHIDGVATNNDVPIAVFLSEWLPIGLNMGNYQLYHVENGATNQMTLIDDSATPAHNDFKYNPATGDVTLYMATFSEVALVADTENKWEGEFDYSWYDAEKDELKIANADQLAAFGAIVGGMYEITEINGEGKYVYSENVIQDSFEDKTITLLSDINLGDDEENNVEGKIFYPIGYWNNEGTYERLPVGERVNAVSSGFYSFSGTFDGNGHTISNFYQNTWEMKGDHNWYDAVKEQYYRDGMGLFGRVYGGTVKNLTVSNFSSDGEIATTGVIAAYADGATFENIAITDCNPRVYNIGNGGIVGCVGWYAKEKGLKTTFTNITVDNSNKISALWGSYDVACGGIVGQYYPTSGQSSANYPVNAGIDFENCHVAAQMDVYNDVCANYQYYAYRYTGMMIGSVRENVTIDGHVYPKMDGITAENCTVHFGDWNDYYYCELVANSLASYTHDHQMSRLTQVASVDVNNKTVTDLDGEITAIPTSGRVNYVVVKEKDANGMWIHGDGHDYAECYHFVNGVQHFHDVADSDNPNPTETVNGVAGVLKEDKQLIYREFNQLFTGYGWGVTSKGIGDLAGITILDREEGNSVVKFEGKVNALTTNRVYTLDEIFDYLADCGVEVIDGSVNVTITNLDDNGNVIANFVRGNAWNEGTISFENTGNIEITIQDYYFCTATTITVNVSERQNEEKFDIVMNNGDFLHRVGNSGTVALDKLFKEKDGAKIGTVSVTIEAVDGTGASGIYSNNAIQFNGTGVVKVTIKDDDKYCTPTVLHLEVVDAVNATDATNATSNNVVLLNNCGFSSLEVSGGYTLYGNGFTMTCGSDSAALDFSYSFVTLKNGTLDNIQIVCPNFDYAALYKENLTSTENRSETTDKTRYFNAKSGVMVSGNSQILNSRISGARAAVNVIDGDLLVENSRIELGAVASLLVGNANSLVLRDVTLIQKSVPSSYDNSKKIMGLSVLYICNTDGVASSTTIEGDFIQYAWANESDKQYVPSSASDIVDTVLEKEQYIHNIDGNQAVNLGFAYMPAEGSMTVSKPSNIIDNRDNKDTVVYDFVDVRYSLATVYVYSYKNTYGTDNSFLSVEEYIPNRYGDIVNILYSDNFEGLTNDKYFDTEGWIYELKVDLDKLSGYKLDFSKLSMTVNGVPIADYRVNGSTKPVSPVSVAAGGSKYILTANVNGKEHTATYIVTGVETTKNAPEFIETNWTSSVRVTNGTDYSIAAEVLTGIKVRYWSVQSNQYIDLDLTSLTPTEAKPNGENSFWEYVDPNGDFTLKITNTAPINSSKGVYGMPVVYNNKLYFTVSSTNGMVSSSTASRELSMQYLFKDNNGGETTINHNWTVTKNEANTIKYSDMVPSSGSCITPDTLITLADGMQVRVDSLTGSEKLLVWNMETGKLDSAPIMFVDSESEAEYEIIHLYFSDGTEVKTIYEHGFWDYDLNKYVYLDRNAAQYIGHSFAKQNGGSLDKVELIDVVIETEITTAWSPVTVGHLCYFVNGMLSMPGGVGGLFNIFDVDPETMTYDYEAIEKDIATYGLYTYEDLNAICPLSEEMFNAAGGAYLKISIGKGNLTEEELFNMINRYSKFFK